MKGFREFLKEDNKKINEELSKIDIQYLDLTKEISDDTIDYFENITRNMKQFYKLYDSKKLEQSYKEANEIHVEIRKLLKTLTNYSRKLNNILSKM